MLSRTAVILLFLPFFAFSQSTRFGVVVDYVAGTKTSAPHHYTNTNRPMGFTSKPAYALGVTSLTEISESFLLHASAKYTTRSVSTERSGIADGAVYATLLYEYVTLSPKIYYKFFDLVNIGIGPGVDLNVGSRINATGDWAPVQDPIPQTNKVRWGMSLSAGLFFDLSPFPALMTDITYDHGLTNTHDGYGKRYSSTLFSLSIFL